MKKEEKFDRDEVTHFSKFNGTTKFFRVKSGRLYQWVLDRWIYECRAKDFKHKLEQL